MKTSLTRCIYKSDPSILCVTWITFPSIWFFFYFVHTYAFVLKNKHDNQTEGKWPMLYIVCPDNLMEWIRPWLSPRRFNISRSQSLFLFGALSCSTHFVTFPFIRGVFASWICHCCLTSSVILSASIYRSVDTTNNSEVTWPKACTLHFRYKQWQKIPCYIFYDMRKNVNILNDSHVIVKFELRNKLLFRMRLVWRNTTSSFHFW